MSAIRMQLKAGIPNIINPVKAELLGKVVATYTRCPFHANGEINIAQSSRRCL
jgi:hypothetical protein